MSIGSMSRVGYTTDLGVGASAPMNIAVLVQYVFLASLQYLETPEQHLHIRITLSAYIRPIYHLKVLYIQRVIGNSIFNIQVPSRTLY